MDLLSEKLLKTFELYINIYCNEPLYAGGMLYIIKGDNYSLHVLLN